MGRVAVLGLGLMGGSIARAISELQIADRVTGWSPVSSERDAALTVGAVTFAAAGWREAVVDADLVVVATPLSATLKLVGEIGDATGSHVTVTDVAGLKAPLEEAASRGGLADRWVGSHPMAGSESSGFWASRADLFQGARVWIVAAEAANDHRLTVERLWSGIGAVPCGIGATEHDHLMASVSHLPQLVANILAEVLEQAGVDPDRLGPGGRDMTRLAASDPGMWADILAHASPALVGALRGVSDGARRMADRLEAEDLEAIVQVMKRTGGWRGR